MEPAAGRQGKRATGRRLKSRLTAACGSGVWGRGSAAFNLPVVGGPIHPPQAPRHDHSSGWWRALPLRRPTGPSGADPGVMRWWWIRREYSSTCHQSRASCGDWSPPRGMRRPWCPESIWCTSIRRGAGDGPLRGVRVRKTDLECAGRTAGRLFELRVRTPMHAGPRRRPGFRPDQRWGVSLSCA